jgi:hypothetical protein
MEGVSTLVGTVLLLLVAFLAISAFALVLRGTGGIWPRTTPKVYLQLVGAFGRDNLTELVFQQQGGETLRTSDLSLVLEGTLTGGERERNPAYWCSENELRTGKFTIRIGKAFENIERLVLLHRPTGATVFSLFLPLEVSQQ